MSNPTDQESQIDIGMTEASMTSAVNNAQTVFEDLPDDSADIDPTQFENLATQAKELQSLADQICKKISRGKEKEEKRPMLEFLDLVKKYGKEVKTRIEEIKNGRGNNDDDRRLLEDYNHTLKKRYHSGSRFGNNLIVCDEERIFALVFASEEQCNQAKDLIHKMGFEKNHSDKPTIDFSVVRITNGKGSRTITDEIWEEQKERKIGRIHHSYTNLQ